METKVNSRDKTQREKDKFLPGWEEFMKLSRGIMEEEEEESILLAKPPESYEAFPDEVDQGGDLDEKKKKAKKPDCAPGNSNHSISGKFSTKANAGSWSKTHPDGRGSVDPSCKHGQYRSRGRWTKVRCGRELVNGKPSKTGKKAKYRCYDGKKVRQERQAREALALLPSELARALVFEVVNQTRTDILNEGQTEQIEAQCKSAGFYNLKFFLELQDNLTRSANGDLMDTK